MCNKEGAEGSPVWRGSPIVVMSSALPLTSYLLLLRKLLVNSVCVSHNMRI